MKIAAAQIGVEAGDIERNLQTHLAFIEAAAGLGVDGLVFPELSLTGYEPGLAASLALTLDDARLTPLAETAVRHGVHVVVGAPLVTPTRPAIGALLFAPSGQRHGYAKMHLHTGEEQWFSAGQQHCQVPVADQTIGIAICADANYPQHARAHARQGTSVYAVSAMITADGYPKDTENLANHARDHQMLVLLANHHQPTGGWVPTGKSAAWTPSSLLVQAPEKGDVLVVAERANDAWRGEVIPL